MGIMLKENKPRLSLSLTLLGGTVIGVLSLYEAFYILSAVGQSVSSDVVISSVLKELLSLHIFTGLSSTTSALMGSLLLLKKHLKASIAANALSICAALATLINPERYGFQLPLPAVIGSWIGIALIAAGAVTGLVSPRREAPRSPLLKSLEVATTAVFSALYAVMILLLVVPSPTGGYTHIGDTVVFVAAILFGGKVGGLAGILGSVAADIYTAYPRWYVSILAHGLEGAVAGFAKGKSLPVQILACVAGGFLMATTYFVVNVFLKGYPLALLSYVRDLAVQAGVSIAIAVVASNTVKRVLPQTAKP